ncbi:MAG: BREX system P-loop protein BrxC, partial [Thermoplasmata archaeon]|nr:BREX system P-loop protein BrxC [Thermoplasmata archaeon]
LVFVFDEVSEAINQKKFTLLDLEGISEALSSISNKVWTIAISQEKLDDVINNTNVNRSQLTKVIDRFKTKIHLDSTEVNVIIQSRLLRKTETGRKQLVDYYEKNEGLVSDATNLKSSFPTKTADAEEFATYYPFHRYQFDILQKFLFSSNSLVATQIAARGMIITTFDVLRKQMREKELYSFTPGHSICTEAQTAPPIGLANKYDTAKKILKERGSTINGEELLKTIHLLADSEVVSPTVENITKSYISDITKYYALKPSIEEALMLVLEAKVLLLSNNNYKITSDLEGKLLEEMNDFDVEFFTKKRSLIYFIKNYKLFAPIATFSNGTDSFKFSVLSDQDDELTGPGSKHLKIRVYSLFNISENRQDFIETLKLETQHQKDLITLVPDNKEFSLIDKLIAEISRYSYMEEKYSSESDAAKRQIIRDFSIIREEKEKELRGKIEKAYRNASLIYMFDEHLLNADSFKGTISDIQRKLINNIYTKKLTSNLSEGLVPKIFSSRKEGLSVLFSGDDFKFFDSQGNFIGDHLKVVEEINDEIKNRHVDGRTLESDLSGAPWGYSFGTIVSTLAALFRAGRLSVKYNGDTWFSHEHNGIQDAFTNATKFKSASFRSITATLTAAQKNQAVQLLMDLEIESHTRRKVDWNINDFDLADSIRHMADHFSGALTTLGDTVEGFESLFPTVAGQKQTLLSFSGKITESNYIEKVEFLLTNSDLFRGSIQTILTAQKFIKKDFPRVREFKRFIEEVVSELKKADRKDVAIQGAYEEFIRLYKQDMVKNVGGLQQQGQIVKDEYYKLIKNAAAGMSHEYQLLSGKIDAAQRTLKGYPADLNASNQKKLDELKRYCTDRIIREPVLEYAISCKNCGYSLSDILNYTALAPTKDNELVILQSSFIAEAPKPGSQPGGGHEQPPVPKTPRKVCFQVTSKVMTVQEYKTLLTNQLTLLAAARPDEEIELDIETSWQDVSR